MKILPTMNKGIVLLHDDGSFEMAPLQVFRGEGGGTLIRIGQNMLFFDKNGRWDGCESKLPGEEPEARKAALEQLKAAYELQGINEGKAPEEPYFAPGTSGWTREVRAWTKARPDSDTASVGHTYSGAPVEIPPEELN